MQPIKIDIWSDIACPWCYIGKRRLERALSEFEGTPDAPPVEIEYHSFELMPDVPVDFEGSQEDFFLRRKGWPPAQVEQMHARVTAIAASVGLAYDMPSVQLTNTVKAHQLLHYAKAHGTQLELKERLLAAYFIEGRHVGRVADLADLAAELGLDRDDVLGVLERDGYLDAVHADQEQARQYGISGVPFYVIDGKYGISGAQDSAVFLEALTTVAAEREEDVA